MWRTSKEKETRNKIEFTCGKLLKFMLIYGLISLMRYLAEIDVQWSINHLLTLIKMTNGANSKRENENSNQETINGNNLWTGCRCEVGMWDFVPFHYKEKDCGVFLFPW